nr:RNA:NAD 2'-phosphotransferase [uncultured bacterium]
MKDRTVKISKFLSLVLRHKPEEIGIQLDAAGWVPVTELLSACQAHGFSIKPEELEEVVRTNDKQRFAFSEDGSMIRASQGHSVEVKLDYQPLVPPEILYHGTATRFLDSIKEQGLIKGKRHHVHLSGDEATAIKVGARHGKAVVLVIESLQMHKDGFIFYQSENGVWLTEKVPANYMTFPTV